MTKSIVKPNSILDLGLRHSEQVDLLRHIQQQLLDKQSVHLKEEYPACPKCGGKLYKSGYIKSDFHAVFTDHKVAASRQICKHCNMRWSREGLHALLQVRAAVNSNDWNSISQAHIAEAIYHKAA